MELIVLGSGSAIPTPERSCPGYLVRCGDHRLLLDCGPGTMRRLAELREPVGRISGILVTHYHPDHVSDLVPILFSCCNADIPIRDRALAVRGPKGIDRYVEQAVSMSPAWLRRFPARLSIEPLVGREEEIAGFAVRSRRVAHTAGALAFRITCRGRSLAYSGDTDECPGIVEIGRRASLFVLETAWPEGSAGRGHLTPSKAGRIAAEANPDRLLLTHFYPNCEGQDFHSLVGKSYRGEILLAEDGMRLRW